MKITKMEEQGLRLVISLARSGGRSTLRELADKERLSPPLVAKIVGRLRRAGIVNALRGRHGCYELAAEAEQLTVAQVLRAFGPALLQGCFNTDHTTSSRCPHIGDCTIRPVWLHVEDRVRHVLEQVTIASLLNEVGQVRRSVYQLWPLPSSRTAARDAPPEPRPRKPVPCPPPAGAEQRAAV